MRRGILLLFWMGLSYYEKEAGHGGRGKVVNCIVWRNEREVSYDGLSLRNVSYSIVGGEAVWPGEGSRNGDPLFLDGWEINNGLNPTSNQDAPEDSDGDGHPTWRNTSRTLTVRTRVAVLRYRG